MIVKRVPKPHPTFKEFIRNNLPDSLLFHCHWGGSYSPTKYYIEQRETGNFFGIFKCNRNKVAEVGDKKITLLDNSWHSDIVGLMIKYESKTAKELTLIMEVDRNEI